jgi:hypothetical protein
MGKPKLCRLESGEQITPREIVRRLLQAGKKPSPTILERIHGIPRIDFRNAIMAEQAYIDGYNAGYTEAPLDPSILNASYRAKYDALVKRYERRFEQVFNNRVSEEVKRHINEYLMPLYKDRLEKAERVMTASRGKPFTNEEYRLLLSALHPESDELRRARAFQMIKDKEVVLRTEERGKPLTSGLPTSVEELLARRKTAWR